MGIERLMELNRGAVRTGAAAEAARTIRAARESDAHKIAELYKSVHITGKYVKAGAFKGFSSRGGMFEIPSQKEILSELKPQNTLFTVGDLSGNIEAVMRLSPDLSEYSGLIAANANTLNYVELIVRSRDRHFSYPFLLANFIHLKDAGYKSLVFQIYHLLSLEASGKSVILGIDNNASCELNRKIGAEKIGELRQKTLFYDGTALNIRPDIYTIELFAVVQKLEHLCAKTGWRFN